MKYMLMIFGQDDWWDTATAEELAASMEAHNAFAAYLQSRGGEISGEALHPSKSATTLRPASDGDGFVVTDGPFIETHEQIAGYYLIDAPDQSTAVQIAKRVPGARIGAVEVRPVVELSGLPGD